MIPPPSKLALKTSQFASSWYGGPEAKNSFSYKRSQREDYSASQISWVGFVRWLEVFAFISE